MNYVVNQYRPTKAIVHLGHLKHNITEIQKRLSPSQFICPMVKANAYGHGDIEVAKTLQSVGVQHLGVGLVEEGISLRQNGIAKDVIFFGLFDEKSAPAVLQYNLTPVISDFDQLRILLPYVQNRGIKIHLKFNTGMHRLGLRPEEATNIASWLDQHRQFDVVGVMTHLANGEDIESKVGESRKQIQTLQMILGRDYWPKAQVHALNSAGFIGALRSQNEFLLSLGVRPGLLMYGQSPVKIHKEDPQVLPVMCLESKIIKIHKLKKGQSVSYGGTWSAPGESYVGVVPIGYADGYHRSLSNRSEVIISGEKVPVIGNVCMDYLMVDLTRPWKQNQWSTEFILSEPVTLLGRSECGLEVTAEELAQKAQTISWEVLTSVSERVPRVYTEEVSKSIFAAETDVHR